MKIGNIFGVNKMAQNLDKKVAIEKLEFLALEFERGNSKISDLRFWKAELEFLNHLDNGKSFAVTKTISAYQLIYRLFLSKHGLTGNEEEANEVVEETI